MHELCCDVEFLFWLRSDQSEVFIFLFLSLHLALLVMVYRCFVLKVFVVAASLLLEFLVLSSWCVVVCDGFVVLVVVEWWVKGPVV